MGNSLDLNAQNYTEESCYKERRGKTILRWIDERLDYWVNIFLYSYMAIIIALEVFRRYILGESTTWAEETAIYAFIWMAYIAAARGVRNRSHLAITLVRDRFNRTGTFFCLALSDACFLILAITVTYFSLNPILATYQYNQKMMGINLPMALALASVTVGWSLIAFRVIRRFFSTLGRFRKGKPLLDTRADVLE